MHSYQHRFRTMTDQLPVEEDLTCLDWDDYRASLAEKQAIVQLDWKPVELNGLNGTQYQLEVSNWYKVQERSLYSVRITDGPLYACHRNLHNSFLDVTENWYPFWGDGSVVTMTYFGRGIGDSYVNGYLTTTRSVEQLAKYRAKAGADWVRGFVVYIQPEVDRWEAKHAEIVADIGDDDVV